ncbi:MAG TPA: AAA family ATPase [Bacteroidota bacterium]|nr:AAA family ATPase [Bacteroidota bacterium]
MIFQKVILENYKCFRHLELDLRDSLTLLVGDNETGKSTLIEAVNLCLTQELFGRNLAFDISPYLFNRTCVSEYLKALNAHKKVAPPTILIELYFKDTGEFASLKGTNNSKRVNLPGVRTLIEFDQDFSDEYESYISDPKKIKNIPTEYYRVHWYSFANSSITKRTLATNVTFIDTTTIRLQYGSDYYIQKIVEDSLNPKERAELAVEYRMLKETFANREALNKINEKLASSKGTISKKKLQVSIDISQKANWETNLTSYLDDIPFQHIGKGDQSILKMLIALDRKAVDAHLILIEEPENHLSYSMMNYLIGKIQEKCAAKQVILATHSTFVLNRLGIDKVILLSEERKAISLRNLSEGTQEYFQKLPGYDTLRLIIAKKPILVEGPSDELIVQKAYLQMKGNLPIEDGFDVIAVRSLSFKRFLEIAVLLNKKVAVITDNDGNYKKNVEAKYADYIGNPQIGIFYDKENKYPTLEYQIAKVNDLRLLNTIFSRNDKSKETLIQFMIENKTDCALKLFNFSGTVSIPQYILDVYGD